VQLDVPELAPFYDKIFTTISYGITMLLSGAIFQMTAQELTMMQTLDWLFN
jgi:hypothetical protein